MLLIYMSVTGNVGAFIKKVNMKSIELDYIDCELFDVNEDYIIVIPTYEGLINDEVSKFIEHNNNLDNLIGFVSSGNINFDNSYCINAKQLSEKYNKPLILTFEFEGTEKDIEDFKREVERIEITRVNTED